MSNDILQPIRAKSVSIATERVDKYGKRRNSKTRNHIVPLHGMATAKEAEKIGRDMANELGVSDDRVIVETYKKGEAPIEANPRHRGWSTRVEQPRKQREIVAPVFQRVRNVFSFGWNPLSATPEEVAAYVAAFEEAKLAGRDPPER